MGSVCSIKFLSVETHVGITVLFIDGVVVRGKVDKILEITDRREVIEHFKL